MVGEAGTQNYPNAGADHQPYAQSSSRVDETRLTEDVPMFSLANRAYRPPTLLTDVNANVEPSLCIPAQPPG
jgi:hypothetical protein